MTTFDSMAIQQRLDGGRGHVVLTVYVCLDVSNVDIVDETGVSIVAEGRDSRLPLEIDLDDIEGGLKVSRSELWSGQDFC
jgi:hypothetical protein